jgi:hypothetical protein
VNKLLNEKWQGTYGLGRLEALEARLLLNGADSVPFPSYSPGADSQALVEQPGTGQSIEPAEDLKYSPSVNQVFDGLQLEELEAPQDVSVVPQADKASTKSTFSKRGIAASSQQTLSLDIGSILHLEGTYTQNPNRNPGDPIAVVNGVTVTFKGAFSNWQPSQTINGLQLFDNEADLSSATFNINGTVSNPSILDFVNLRGGLNNLKVTFDNTGGVRSNFQVASGSFSISADHGTLFGQASGLLSAVIPSTGNLADPAFSGVFDLAAGTLALNAKSVVVTIGSAVQATATNVTFNLRGSDPPSGSTIATADQVSVKFPELKDANSNPLQINFDPVGTTPALSVSSNGLQLNNGTLGPVSFGIDGILSAQNLSATFSNIALSQQNGSYLLGGTVQFSASTASLFPSQTVVSSSLTGLAGSYNFGTASSGLKLSAAQVQLVFGEALQVAGQNVVFTPGSDPIATIASVTLSSPKITGLTPLTAGPITINRNGFLVGSAQLGTPAGQSAAIGNFLSVKDVNLQLTNFGFSFGAASAVQGTISLTAGSLQLFPGSTVFTSTMTGVSGTYDFSASGGGALTVTVANFDLVIGEALELTASGVRITPGASTIATIATVTVKAPKLGSFGTATVNGLVVTQDGFSLQTLTLGQAGGQTANFGNYLRVTGAQVVATNFGYSIANGFSGTVQLNVAGLQLFPGSSVFTSTMTGISGTYDFSASGGGALTVTVANFDLVIGEALELTASGVRITPGAITIATIATATVKAPRLGSFGTATVNGLVVTQDGFSLQTLTLGQAGGQTADFGTYLRVTAAQVVATNFGYSIANGFSGTVKLTAGSVVLYPSLSFITSSLQNFSATYDFSQGGQLAITVGTFNLQIGEALKLTASGIVITPSQTVIAAIDSALVQSPQLSGLGVAVLKNFQLTQTGFSFDSLELAQPAGQTVTIGNFVQLSGVNLQVTNFAVNTAAATPVSGSLTITIGQVRLFPSSSFITSSSNAVTGQYDFGNGGRLVIAVNQFTLNVGQALALTVNQATVTPGQPTIATIQNATVTSPQFPSIPAFTLAQFVIRQDGFSFDQFTMSAPGTIAMGNYLSLQGVTISVNQFAFNSTNNTTTGNLNVSASSVALFPNGGLVTSTITGITLTYDFSGTGSGKLQIGVDTLDLQVGQALKFHAEDFTLTPGDVVIAHIQGATLSSPQFSRLGTLTLDNLDVRQDGFSLAQATLNPAGGGAVTIGNFISFSNLKVIAEDLDVTIGATTSVTGRVYFTADQIQLFPGSTLLTSQLNNFSGSYDFSAGGALRISVGDFSLKIGQALSLGASNVVITPGATVIASIDSAFVTSPGLSNLGTLTLSGLTVTQTGLNLGSATFRQPTGLTATFGNYLSLTGVVISLSNFSVTYGSGGTSVSGSISFSADSAKLYPNGGFIKGDITGFTASFDFSNNGAGKLKIVVPTFSLAVGEALLLKGTQVTITPGEAVIATVGSATISSPQFSQLPTVSVDQFQLNQDGFSFNQLSMTANGPMTLGNFVTVQGFAVTATNFKVTYGDNPAVSGTLTVQATGLSLFPNSSIFKTTATGLTAQYDFSQSGSLAITIGQFTLQIGEALQLQASGVTVTPGQAVIATLASATLSSPQFSQLGTLTVNNLAIRQDGFTLGQATLNPAGGGAVTIGNFLSFTNLKLIAEDFAVTVGASTSVTGRIYVTADQIQLFPGSSLLTSQLTNFSGSYDFSSSGALRISVGSFQLQIGQALILNASNVTITPGATVIASIDSAFVTSPGLSNLGTLTLSGLQVTQTGLSVSSATLQQPAGLTATFGNYLSLTGVVITLSNLNVTYGSAGTSVSGSITLTADQVKLYPNGGFIKGDITGFTASFDFSNGGVGKLKIVVQNFSLGVGEALLVKGSQVTITPADDVIATVANGTISSPQFTQLPTVSFNQFQLNKTGFSFAQVNLTAPGTITLGNFLSVQGLSVTATNFAIAYGDNPGISGTLTVAMTTVSLFPNSSVVSTNATGVTGSYDFAQGLGSLRITVPNFELSIGEALKVTAQNVVITPGQDTLVTISGATATSPKITGLQAATLSDLVITRTGFTLGNLTIQQAANQTAAIGSLVDFTGLVVSVNNLSVTQGDTLSVSGTVLLNATEVALFPNSTILTSNMSEFSGSYQFGPNSAGQLNIQIGSFELAIGQALKLNASNVSITPSNSTMASIQQLTLSSPMLSNLGTLTIDSLDVLQTGFTIGHAQIQQPAGKVATIGNFLTFSNAGLTVDNLSVQVGATTQISGNVTVSGNVTLLPNAKFLTSDFKDVTASYDFSPTGSGDLNIHIGQFGLNIGEALRLSATGVDIHPNQDQLLTIASATLSSPAITGLDSAAVSGFVLTKSGFTLNQATLSQTAGQTATIGRFLSFSGLSVTANNLVVQYGDTVSIQGTVGLQAANLTLFPGVSMVKAAFNTITGSYNFSAGGLGALSISIGNFVLGVADAVQVSGTNVTITPGQQTIATIGTATVSSPKLNGLQSGTITNFVIRQDGFSFGSLVLTQTPGQTAQIGSLVSFSGASLSINNFALSTQASGTTVSGSITLTASSIALFPANAFIRTSAQGVEILYSFGDAKLPDGTLVITIGTFQMGLINGSATDFSKTALLLSASNVTVTPGADTVATISSASVSSPRFTNLPNGTLAGLTITQTGFSIASLTLAGSATNPVTLGSLFQFTGLSITVTNLVYSHGSSPSLGGTISVGATSATVFPGSSLFTASVTGFNGTFNLNTGALSLTATSFQFAFGSVLQVSASNLSFNPDSDPVFHADTATVTIPSLSISGTATSLEVSAAGIFSVVSISLNTQGLTQALGIANFLPVNVSQIGFKFLGDTNGNGQRDSGEVFDLTAFDLTVTGAFNFASMQGLPFTPTIKIGSAANSTSFSSSAPSTFSFTLTVVDGKVKPKDLGPIEIDFTDLKVGQTVTLGGGIKLGGYQNGVWVDSFGGSISVQTQGQVSGVTGAAATIVGDFDESTGRIDATATLSVSFNIGQSIQVKNAGLGFHVVLTAKTGGGFSLDTLSLTGASVEQVNVTFGSFLTLQATNVFLDFNPAPGGLIATFGSLTATLTDLGIGGTARNFGIDEQGHVKTLDGFGVTLDLSDSSKVSWPSWLPIQVTYAGITWKDFNADITDFQITLSATVTSINGLSELTVSGSIDGVVIDVGLLKSGKFPIVDLQGVGVSISGNAFGGQIEGALFLEVLKLDSAYNVIQSGDTTTAVEYRVFYGGLQAGFSFAGAAGFSIQLGLSQYGPLEVYMSASIPIVLEPISGLSITNFRAGVDFNTTLPAVTDPFALRGSAFQPASELTFAQWQAQLKQSVINQVKATGGGTDFWAAFTQPMKIQGGATLFSQYASQESFKADIDIIISTDGKFVINARMTFANSLKMTGILYADLTQVAAGAATILFLVDEPGGTPVITYFGGIEFLYTRSDGQPVTTNAPGDTFQIRISGGVQMSALKFINMTIQGTVVLSFRADHFDVDLTGTVSVKYLGDAIGVAGKVHVDNSGTTTKIWGALVITTNFEKLEKIGLFVDASAVLRLNVTDQALTETLDVPGKGTITVDLSPLSFSVLIDGSIHFKLSGTEWFDMQGTFGMEINQYGFYVFADDCKLIIGPSDKPFLQLNFDGFLAILDTAQDPNTPALAGIAAKLDLTLATNFPPDLGIDLSASFSVLLNTTGQTITYTLPASVTTVPGGGTSRTIVVSASPPGSTDTSPFLYIKAVGKLTVLTFELNGTFEFLASTDVLQITAEADMVLKVKQTTLFSLHASGGMHLDSTGLIAAIDLTRNGALPDLGFSFSANVAFRLELNTTGQAATIAGVTLKAADYALVRITGSLVVSGFSIDGYFELSVGSDGLALQAYAKMDLVIGSKKLFSFTVAGGFIINDQGLAAALQLSLAENLPTDLGFTLDVSFTFEVNTTPSAVVIAGINLPSGPFAQVAAHGLLTVQGFKLQGDFDITIAAPAQGDKYVQIDAVASLNLQILGVNLLQFNVNAGLRLSDKGIAAVMDLSLAAGIPDSYGFSLTATFSLHVNTTSQAVTVGGVALPAGPFGQIIANGTLSVLGLSIKGTFVFTVGTNIVAIAATATLDLTIEEVTLLSFSVAGGFQVDSDGLVASFALTLAAGSTFPSGYGMDFSLSFGLEINTTGLAKTISGSTITVAAGKYGQISANGSITIGGFQFTGSLLIQAGPNGFIMEGTLSLKIFGASVSATIDLALLKEGVAASVLLDLNLIDLSFLTIKGSFGLELNTTSSTQFNVAPHTVRVFVQNVVIDVLGLKISGSLSIGVVNGSFSIDVPATDPLTLDFFGIATVQVYGHIGTDSFSITGTVDLDFGDDDIMSVKGSMSVTVSSSGISGSLSGNVIMFNQSILAVTGSLSITSDGFRIVATAAVKLPSPLDVLTLNGDFDISIGKSGIKASIEATINIWDVLTGTVGVFVDTGSGSWFVHGSASFSIGGSDLGASASVAVDVGYLSTGQTLFDAYRDSGWHLALTLGGSAWAGFSIAGHFIGVSVDLSATIDLVAASVSVEISGTILFIHWHKSITIDFKNGVHISLSNVAGSIVFLDRNGNNVLDPGEPATIADESGKFTFNPGQTAINAGNSPQSPFALLDSDHDNFIDSNEGRFFLIGGTSIQTRAPNTTLLELPAGEIVGTTHFSGATVFIDTNSNRALDAGEYTVKTTDSGTFSFFPVLFPTTTPSAEDLLGSLKPFDKNVDAKLDSSEGQLILSGGTNASTGLKNSATIVLSDNKPTGFTQYHGATITFDANKNGVKDANEVSTTSSGDGRYSFVHTVAPDLSTNLGSLANYDLNKNGFLEPSEGKIYAVNGTDKNTNQAVQGLTLIGNSQLHAYSPTLNPTRVFFDANLNRQFDVGEASVQVDAKNFYTFLPPSTNKPVLGLLAKFDKDGDGQVDSDEGQFKVIGGVDKDNGLPNVQVLKLDTSAYGNGVRNMASPLAHLHGEVAALLKSQGKNSADADWYITSALGLPMNTGVLTFDPTVEAALGTGAHHDVLATSAQLTTFVTLWGQHFQGTANGQITNQEAQDTLYKALAQRIVQITPRQTPKVDANNMVVGDAPLIDLTDATLQASLFTAAVAIHNASTSQGTGKASSIPSSSGTLLNSVSSQSIRALALPESKPSRIILQPEVTSVAAQVVADHMAYLEDIGESGLSNVTTALARVKHVARTLSAKLLHEMARGDRHPIDVGALLHIDNLKTYMDAQNLPSGNHAPTMKRVEDVSIIAGQTVSIQLALVDPDELPEDIKIRVFSSAGNIVPASSITVTGAGQNRVLTITTNSAAAGIAQIYVELSDDRDSNVVTFTVRTREEQSEPGP